MSHCIIASTPYLSMNLNYLIRELTIAAAASRVYNANPVRLQLQP